LAGLGKPCRNNRKRPARGPLRRPEKQCGGRGCVTHPCWACFPQKAQRTKRLHWLSNEGSWSSVAAKRKKIGLVIASSKMPAQPPTAPFSFRIGLWPIGSRQLLMTTNLMGACHERCAAAHVAESNADLPTARGTLALANELHNPTLRPVTVLLPFPGVMPTNSGFVPFRPCHDNGITFSWGAPKPLS
jgi:hypothetical protein